MDLDETKLLFADMAGGGKRGRRLFLRMYIYTATMIPEDMPIALRAKERLYEVWDEADKRIIEDVLQEIDGAMALKGTPFG